MTYRCSALTELAREYGANTVRDNHRAGTGTDAISRPATRAEPPFPPL
jgi:hypothetical protein